MKPWQRQEPTIVQKVGWRTMVTKHFLVPDGTVQDFTVMNEDGSRAVAVIALTENNQVVIARQFRPGPELVMDEIPGGAVERDEEPQAAVLRELTEETGYVAGSVKLLGKEYKDSYNNASWYYYLALDCRKSEAGQSLDDYEYVDVVLITIDELISNAKEGRMTDSGAVLFAYEELHNLKKS